MYSQVRFALETRCLVGRSKTLQDKQDRQDREGWWITDLGKTYLEHFEQGEPLSHALLSRLHSRQLCCGLPARDGGDEPSGDDEVADMLCL